MKLDKYSNTVSRAIAVAGITAAAITGCRPAEKEVTQRDEQVEMVKNTRRSIGKKKYETDSRDRLLEGEKSMTLSRYMVERARVEKKIILPGEVDDITLLSGVPIEEFELEHNGGISRLKDLSPLTGAPLKKINIYRSLVEDIEALRDMPLEKVDIRDTEVADLTPLEGKNIRVLKISNSLIESLEPVRGMPLEIFHMGSGNIIHSVKTSDISPLEDCPLKEVILSQVQISDISVLKGMPIEVLRLDKTNVKDISALKGMPLRILDLTYAGVSDVPVGRTRQLRRLIQGWTPIANTGLKDLSALRGMPLKKLRLGLTPVTDLSPLAGMPLEYLDLGFTHVRNLEALKGMPLKELRLGFTPVTDLSPLAGMPLEYLELSESVRDLRPIKDIVDRLRKKKRALNFSPCLQINWDTYQLEIVSEKLRSRDCN